MTGPLAGVRVIEVAGIGPGPFAAMILADMGADVIRVDRAAAVGARAEREARANLLNRGRRSIAIDLKQAAGVAVLLRLVDSADALIEGFRPGVAERLGFGPDVCLRRRRQIVYGRMTGWGQDGPYAQAAGHDINYISLAGALEPIGRSGQAPVPPLNLLGDFGAGGMLMAFGIVCGVLEARSSGRGQVVDAAIVDGTALLTTMIHGLRAMGRWGDERGTNMLDTGAPYYDVYETSDGKYVSVGAIEPQFYDLLLGKLGREADLSLSAQDDVAKWPAGKAVLAAVFRSRTRDEWCALLDATDACFAPVLSMAEAAAHPHNAHRGLFVDANGFRQPAPAPRFDRTPGAIQSPPPLPGEHTEQVLKEAGFTADEISDLRAEAAVRSAPAT
jgi:alpha-methylacyl-CoA racemase